MYIVLHLNTYISIATVESGAQTLLTGTCQLKDSHTSLYRLPAILVLSASSCHRLYPVLIPGVTSRRPLSGPSALLFGRAREHIVCPQRTSELASERARRLFCCSDLLLVGERWRRWSLLRAERFRSCFCWCFFRCKCRGEFTNRCWKPWLPLLLHQQQQQ